MHANNRPTDTNLLSATELHALDARIADSANQWLIKNTPTFHARLPRKQKNTTGPKPKVIINPFYGFIGAMTSWERYPRFAMDIIEGIARLDWHDRSKGAGGKSMPLSVHNLALILESLPTVTNESIEDLLELKERHARRYLTAIKLIIPRMMKSRPSALLDYMEGINSAQKTHDWEDSDDASTPSTEVLAKLHYDLRTLAQFKSAEEYEAEYEAELNRNFVQPTIAQVPGRLVHPMKAKVMQMLRDGAQVKPISRETKVDPKTIRKWRDEAAELETSQVA